jgi:hypothetical protein
VALGDAVALGDWGLMKATFLFSPTSANRLGILLKKGVAGFAAEVVGVVGNTGFDNCGGIWGVWPEPGTAGEVTAVRMAAVGSCRGLAVICPGWFHERRSIAVLLDSVIHGDWLGPPNTHASPTTESFAIDDVPIRLAIGDGGDPRSPLSSSSFPTVPSSFSTGPSFPSAVRTPLSEAGEGRECTEDLSCSVTRPPVSRPSDVTFSVPWLPVV